MRVILAAACVFAATLALGSAARAVPAAPPTDNAITQWSAVAASAISVGRSPASSSVLAGMVHGAMYDAVASIEGGLRPFATGVTAPPGANVDAAVAQAARDVLVARVPGQAAFVQTSYDGFMAAIPDGPAKDAGKAVGTAAAAGMLAMRTGDHFDDVVPWVQPTPGPGVFEPIAATPPVDVKLPYVRPFTLESASELRPGPPLDLTSKRYARDLAEVQSLGRSTSTTRTAAQTETVRFFTDHTYVQFSRAARELAKAQGLDLRETARLLAYVHVAAADTMIACWEAKYHYLFWRPNHAIARADTDGNPLTSPESGWLPLVVGNHPEYPSGHTCFTAAVTESLRRYFGTDRLNLVVSSSVTGTSRTYADLDDLVADVENARVWGGLHFRTTMTESAKHFPKIARRVGQEHFLGPRSNVFALGVE